MFGNIDFFTIFKFFIDSMFAVAYAQNESLIAQP
jgi:hypothetical protein